MRSFDERKAEIFKRSNERIAKRKNTQKRILTICIPLVLCVTVLSVIFIPKIAMSNDKNAANEYVYTSDVAYTSLEVKNNAIFSTYSKNYNNQIDINRAYTVIASYFADNDCLQTQDTTDKGTDTKKENYNGGGYTQDASKSLSYTITFSSQNGVSTTYTLDENTLTNKATKETVILTDAQLSQLKKVLDLK